MSQTVIPRPDEPCDCGATPDTFRLLDCGAWGCDKCGNPQTDDPDGSLCWFGAA